MSMELRAQLRNDVNVTSYELIGLRNIGIELGMKILHNEEPQALYFSSINKGAGIA
jgi:hypothetical protein